MARTQFPDYSIGATVLVVAIAWPFFVFTRAEQAHRAGAARPAAATATVQTEAVTVTPDATGTAMSSPSPQAQPSRASAAARPSTVSAPVKARPVIVPADATSSPTTTPSAAPEYAPVAVLGLTVTAPLTITGDANGSSDADQTPIAQIIFNFGDGTMVTLHLGETATHTYTAAGTYTVAVAVIDTAHHSSTALLTSRLAE
jgi:PKD repeat protein